MEAHFQVHRQVLTALAGSTSSSSAHSVCLGLAGDCMWMRDSWTSWQTGDGLQRLLSLVDALVANLETPLHNATPTNMAWVFQARALLPACAALRIITRTDMMSLSFSGASGYTVVLLAGHGHLLLARRLPARIPAPNIRSTRIADAAGGRIQRGEQPLSRHGASRVRCCLRHKHSPCSAAHHPC